MKALYIPELLVAIFMANYFYQQEIVSLLALIIMGLAYSHMKCPDEKAEPVPAVDLTPLKFEIEQIKDRFDRVEALAEEAKKQMSLANLKSGFKTLGSKD